MSLSFYFMKSKICAVLFLLSASLTAFGQNTKFSDAELLSFYKVYDYILSHPFNPLEAMQKLLPQTCFSEERMTEILQAEALGRKVELSEKEKTDREKLKQLIQKEKEKYDTEIAAMMQREKISQKKFDEIKKAFHQDTKLQQKVYELAKNNKK